MSEELEALKKKSECQEDRIDLMEERYLEIASKMDSILKKQQIYTEEMVHFREHLMEALTAKSQENKEIQETISGLQENFNTFSKDSFTKDHLETLCKRMTSMNDKLALLDSFKWFIDATNKWRTQLFLGTLRVAAFIIFIYMLAHVEVVKKVFKFFGWGG